MLDTPVLFIVFNRLEVVKKTFEGIRSIQPKEFYIASDGARPDKPKEDVKVNEVRNYILENINWDCNIHTLFSEDNNGCKYGPVKAIKWFFDNVKQGIVLEDDILATESFFRYCELLLNEYRNRKDIGFICGCTVEKWARKQKKSYFKTTIIDGWGWASWDYLIKDFNPDFSILKNENIENVNSIIRNKKTEKLILDLSYKSADNKLDAWDYQMAEYMALNGRYTVYPQKPLVRNIGFIEDSTHTSVAPLWYNDKSYNMSICLENDIEIDDYYTTMYEKDFIPKIKIVMYFELLKKYGLKWCLSNFFIRYARLFHRN